MAAIRERGPLTHFAGGDIQTEMNRLFNTFDTFVGRPATGAIGERMWLPAVDVHETKDDLVLSFDIPGVTEKDDVEG